MTLKSGKIHQGDCVELMRKIDAGSVDLVFADPPFNIGYEYDQYDDRQEDQKYLDWCKEWIGEIHRVLKDDGTFWLAIGDEYAAELKLLAQREIGFHTRSWVIWYYTFGVNCKFKFSRSHAHLFHFVKDAAKFTFNSDDPLIRVPSARALVYGDKRANPAGRLPDDTWILRPQDFQSDAYGFTPDQDTWYFSRVAGTFKERQGFHGCQMPEQLLGRIIRSSSNPGELVLDPFAGSGTTLAVAKKLERDYLGCELSAEYAKAATSRLKQVRAGDPLEGPSDPVVSAPSTMDGVTLESRIKNKNSKTSTAKPANPLTVRLDSSIKSQTQSLCEGIRDAFLATHEGFSTDRVIVDPHLNQAFIEKCQRIGIPGSTTELNRMLLRFRKAKKLETNFEPRRIAISKTEYDQYEFASEMAWKLVRNKYDGISLDEIFCDPNKVGIFDSIAREFSPGFKTVEYRWAALRMRKRDALRKKAIRAKANFPKVRFDNAKPLEERSIAPYHKKTGIYLLKNPRKNELFLDVTKDLGRRLSTHAMHWHSNCLVPAQFAIINSNDNLANNLDVNKLCLVALRNPLLNQDLTQVKS